MPRLSFDSNVLVYTMDYDDRRYPRAKDLLNRAARADCVLTLQSLGEFHHVVRRKRLASAEETASQIEDWMMVFETYAIDAPALREAMAVSRQHRLSTWDALLWAVIKAAGCRVLLTEDLQDGRDLEGVRFVNPFDPANNAIVDLILPPLAAGQ